MAFNPVLSPGEGWQAVIKEKISGTFQVLPVVVWYVNPNGNVEGLTGEPNNANLVTISSLGEFKTYTPTVTSAQNIITAYQNGAVK
jgi:hypothetical protein